MAFQYKLKEQEIDPSQVSKGGKFKVGDVRIKNGTKYTVGNINPETGSVSWEVESVPAIYSTFKEFQELRKFITQLSREIQDEVIDDISQKITNLFNTYRTHIRNKYPEEYKQSKMNENELDEISTSGAAGGYLTKYAFRKPKNKNKLPEGIGATLGPGPKATGEGVKDNYYIKKFKYKLVPKDKNGNYVQKGSGLEVKNF